MRLAVGVLVLGIATARAAAGPLEAPCTGCTLVAPKLKTDAAVPLLVVLHGDRESAKTAARRWQAEALRQGVAVLSLQCPTSEGCKDSWWKWNGDPQWLHDQIAAAGKQLKIDAARIYVAGWSGGATYLGMRATAWDAFAGVVIHGGGMAPSGTECAARAAPTYFLVGDANPLHHLAKGLRAYLEGCGNVVVWDVLRRAGHGAEARALTRKKARAILTWLTER